MPSSPELRGPERSRAALIAGLIVTYVLALGIPIGFKIYFRSGISNLLLLLPLLVTTTTGVVRRLLDRRARWIALPALLPPVGFAVLLLVGILITPYSSYAIWIESVQMGRPTGSVSNIFVLTYAFFSSILSPLVLTMGFVWPIAILAAATLCVTTIVMQSSTLFVITLIAFAVATIVLMARWSHRGHRFAAVLFYLVILIASAALGRLLTGKGVARGSALIDDSVYPRLREIVTEVYPGIPLLYEIPGYGFSFGAKQLGGPTALSSHPLFTIEGTPGETVYLRSVVYDFYDGQSWAISKDALEVSDEEKEYYAFDLYRKGTVTPEPKDLNVSVSIEYFSRIPNTNDTHTMWFEREVPIVEQGSMGTGFLLRKPLRQGDRFVVRRSSTDGSEPPWLSSGLTSRQRFAYLQVPPDLPEGVKILAEVINPDNSVPRTVLENIRGYLAYNARYNLRPDEEMDIYDDDFVAGFLLSDVMEGYCVHFATSFVVLARLAGIPARYATGFLVYFPSDSAFTEVRGFSTHAWPEVWLEGEGWTTWEATAAVNMEYYERIGDELLARMNIDLNRSTSAQIENLFGSDVLAENTEGEGKRFTLPRGFVIAAAAVGGAGLLVLAVLLLGGHIRYLFLSDRAKFRERLRRVVLYYN